MVNILRRWSQPLMVVIATLVIVSFAFWGNRSLMDKNRGDAMFQVYGVPISREQLERTRNKMEVFDALRSGYAEALSGGDPRNPYIQPEDDYDTAAVNTLIFEHEADAMGISATEQEMVEEATRISSQQGEGKLDWDMFVQRVMMPNGFSKNDLDSFLKSSIRLRKVQELLKPTAAGTPGEVREGVLARNQVTEASYVALKKNDFLAGITATDEEVKKRYEEQKDQLKTAELRKVRYVSFSMPPADPAKPLSPSENTKQLQACVNAAYDFTQAIKKGRKFDELIAEQQAKIAENAKTPDKKEPFLFSVAETEPFGKDALPKPFAEDASRDGNNRMEEIGEAIFALKKESPVSAHLIGKTGAYVAMLPEGGIIEPKQKTLEEVKAALMAGIQVEKADEALRKKCEEVQKQIAEAVKAGKSFVEAATAAGLKAEALPAYSATKPAPGALSSNIQQAAAKLAPGEVSEFVPSTEGGLIVYVDSRPVFDETKPEVATEKAKLTDQMNNFRSRLIFREWLKERRHAAGLGIGKPAGEQS